MIESIPGDQIQPSHSANKMKPFFFRISLVATLLHASLLEVNANLIAYEPFDYGPIATGSDANLNPSGGIEGLNGGTGWSGAWDDLTTEDTFGTGNRATGIAGPGDFPDNDRTAPLSFTDGKSNVLPTAGNQVRTSFGEKSVATRQLNGTYGNDGDTIWVSFLAQSASSSSGARWAGFELGDNTGQYFGKPNNSGNWGFASGGTALIDTGTGAGNAVFYVAKLEFVSGLDTLTVWLNPDLDAEPTASAGSSVSISLSSFSEVTLAGRWSTDFDELRIGTTYASVAPSTGETPPPLIAYGANWRFLDTGVAPSPGWQESGFDDSQWGDGPAPLGYGDALSTMVSYGADSSNKHVVTWFRHEFQVVDTSQIGSLRLSVIRDDGAAIYLNGTEVLRDNLPDALLTADTLASSTVFGAGETSPVSVILPGALLTQGTNVIAAQVHQAAVTSSDLRFDLELLPRQQAVTVPAVSLSGGGTLSEEAWQSVPLTITFEPPSDQALSVSLEIGGNALNSDYFTVPNTDLTQVTIPPGTDAVTVQIWAQQNERADGEKTLELSLVPQPFAYTVSGEETLTISFLDSVHQSWVAEFAPGSSLSALVDPAGDADGDGFTGLEERLLGFDPTVANRPGILTPIPPTVTGETWFVRFPWAGNDPMFRYELWMSENLESWEHVRPFSEGEITVNGVRELEVELPRSLTQVPESAWDEAIVGNPLFRSSFLFDETDGTLRLNASGTDIWGTADEAFFIYQSISGNFELTCRVAEMENTWPWAKAGLHLRKSLAADAQNVFLFVSPENGSHLQHRNVAGSSTTLVDGDPSTAAPLWLRLIREDGMVSGYLSDDGSSWTLVGSVEFGGGDCFLGLTSIPNHFRETITAEFDHIELNL